MLALRLGQVGRVQEPVRRVVVRRAERRAGPLHDDVVQGRGHALGAEEARGGGRLAHALSGRSGQAYGIRPACGSPPPRPGSARTRRRRSGSCRWRRGSGSTPGARRRSGARSTRVSLPRPGEQSPTAQSCFVPGIGTTAVSSFVAVQPAPSGTVTAFQPDAVCRSTRACRGPAPRPPTAQTVAPEIVPPKKNDSPPGAGSGVLETCQPDAVWCSASGWSVPPFASRCPNAHRSEPFPAMPKTWLFPFGSARRRLRLPRPAGPVQDERMAVPARPGAGAGRPRAGGRRHDAVELVGEVGVRAGDARPRPALPAQGDRARAARPAEVADGPYAA